MGSLLKFLCQLMPTPRAFRWLLARLLCLIVAVSVVPQARAQSTTGGAGQPAPAGKSLPGDPYITPRDSRSEEIAIELPPADKLLPMAGKLPPIRLEASYTQPVSLRDVLTYALENNLAIRISAAQMDSNKWLLVGALGRFLPDAIMNYQQQFLKGATLIGGVIPATFKTPNVVTSAGFNFPGFQGGRVVFGALFQLNTFKASKYGLKGSINDVLLQVAQRYYELMRQEALLQIQVQAVEVSRAQVKLNRQLQAAGTGTYFNVLQAETQLARDEQALLEQEVALRRAAIQLSAALNANLAVNLLSADNLVRKVRLIDPELSINDLIDIAMENRPELKQYEFLRTAARRNMQVAAAPLYPQFRFYGSVTGSGATLTKTTTFSEPSFTTVPIPGLPPLPVQANNALGVPSPVFPAGVVPNPPAPVRRQVRKSYTIGFRVDWNYPNLGVPDAANVMSAKAVARQVTLQANQQLLDVLTQVRQSYLKSQTAEKVIDVASAQVVSSAEQLRLARVRLANGVGINLDVIQAQQAWVQALANKANAIIDFNIAQAQLLRDMGIITVDTLTSGRLVRK